MEWVGLAVSRRSNSTPYMFSINVTRPFTRHGPVAPFADWRLERNHRRGRYSVNILQLPVANGSAASSGDGSEFKNMPASGSRTLTGMPASASWTADCGVRDVEQHSMRHGGEVVGADLMGQKPRTTSAGEVYA